MITCTTCLGTGVVKITLEIGEVICWGCNGIGEIEYDPNYSFYE